jgi:hypothetical protein
VLGKLTGSDLFQRRLSLSVLVSIEKGDRPARHDCRDGVLVDELRVTVAAQKHAEIVEPRDNALQLDAVDQKDRKWRLVFSNVIEKGVLQILLFVRSHDLSVILARHSRPLAHYPMTSPALPVSGLFPAQPADCAARRVPQIVHQFLSVTVDDGEKPQPRCDRRFQISRRHAGPHAQKPKLENTQSPMAPPRPKKAFS